MPDFSVGSEYPKSSPRACAACTFNHWAILSALHVTVFYIKLCPFSLIVVCTDPKIPVDNWMCQQWHLTTFKTQFREILAFSLFLPPLVMILPFHEESWFHGKVTRSGDRYLPWRPGVSNSSIAELLASSMRRTGNLWPFSPCGADFKNDFKKDQQKHLPVENTPISWYEELETLNWFLNANVLKWLILASRWVIHQVMYGDPLQ